MPDYKKGQRWISEMEPELGLGIVTHADARFVQIHFPASESERKYAIASAPLKRVEFKTGDMVESRAGNPMIWERQTKYTVADLIGAEDMGWMTHATLTELSALIMPYVQYALNYENTLYTARFRTWDAPVISAVPLVPRPNPAATDEYKNVRIKLILR